MPRRREVPKREILPDPKYSNSDVAKFVNVLMSQGKKSVAERIVYGAFESIAKKGGKDPLEVFNQALSPKYRQRRSARTRPSPRTANRGRRIAPPAFFLACRDAPAAGLGPVGYVDMPSISP